MVSHYFCICRYLPTNLEAFFFFFFLHRTVACGDFAVAFLAGGGFGGCFHAAPGFAIYRFFTVYFMLT